VGDVKVDLESLSYAAVDSKPVDADWSEIGWNEDGEGGFSYVEAHRCEGSHTLQQLVDGAEAVNLDPDEVEIDGDILDLDPILVTIDHECPACGAEHYQEGPMMNYYYPVDLDDEVEAAKLIVDTPLCVVKVNGQTGLALTGGGMDLSWEICEAFVRLGFVPPSHFCRDLPRMGPISARKLGLLEACLKGLEAQERWAQGGSERVRQMIAEAKGEVES
jgi:hypothetical protein